MQRTIILLAALLTGCAGPPDGDLANLPEDVEQISSIGPGDGELPAMIPSGASEVDGTGGWTPGPLRRDHEVGGAALLTETRVGENEGFDRIVLEFEDAELAGYHLEYVGGPVHQCGSGFPVEVAGDGWLIVRLQPARAHTEEGVPTSTERHLQPDLPMIKELRMICDFEGTVEWAVGLTKASPFRVLELREPARLVVDIQW